VSAYPRLFEPLTLPGGAVLPNRFLMGSMHTGLEARPNGPEKLAAFHAERARGGVALIVTGGFSPNDEGELGPHRAQMSTDEDARRHEQGIRQIGCVVPIRLAHQAPTCSVTPSEVAYMGRPSFPGALLEFRRRFAGEEECRRYLLESRWPNGCQCPRCNHRDACELRSRALLKCKVCGHQASATVGTVLHGSKLPLSAWFWAAYLVTTHTPGFSALQLQRQLGLKRYETWTRRTSVASGKGGAVADNARARSPSSSAPLRCAVVDRAGSGSPW